MKKILAGILAIASILGMTACSQSAGDDPEESTVTLEHKSFSPIEITSDNTLNSVRVFDTMCADKTQAMFSPLSLNMCLGMLEAGAAGDTKAALDSYLGDGDYANSAAEYLEHAKDFNFKSEGSSKYKNVFELANSFWASKDLTFNKDYIDRVSSSFGAEIDNLDFSKPEKATGKINDWVSDKTHKMIPRLLSPENVSGDTAAVLVNTVYFESAWKSDWEVYDEKKEFTLADGTKKEIELMHSGGASYFENDSATAFSKGYKNGMTFIGILPKKTGEFTLESLDIPSLLKTETREYDVFARAPKLNFRSSFPLTDALKAAGLSDMFDDTKADFTPMQGSADEKFFVSEVLQKTKLELDESGTKAAAATGAVMTNATAAMPEKPREQKFVYLDRPFAFLIYDGDADRIVFMGKVTDV